MSASRTEHYAEQFPPKDADGNKLFVSYRRHNKYDGIAYVYGTRSTGIEQIQAIRFRKTEWSYQRAREWLDKNGFPNATLHEALPDEEPRSPKPKPHVTKFDKPRRKVPDALSPYAPAMSDEEAK